MICGDTLSTTVTFRIGPFQTRNHVKLLFALNAIVKERVRELTDRDFSSYHRNVSVYATNSMHVVQAGLNELRQTLASDLE